jgi:hypothetical protein
MQARKHVRKAGLRETPFGQSINEKTFTSRRAWEWFQLGLASLEEDGLLGGLTHDQRANLDRLHVWTAEIAEAVE